TACLACLLILDSLRRTGGASMSGSPLYRRWAVAAHGLSKDESSERVRAALHLAWVEQIGDLEFEVAWERRRAALSLAREISEPAAEFLAAFEFLTNLTADPLERADIAVEF